MNHQRVLGTLLVYATILYAVAAGANYLWEMAQMPFYVGMRFDDPAAWLRCFQAALADGGFVLLIWLAGSLIRRRWFWIDQPVGWALAFVLGLITAVGIELWALARGRWAYSPIMPLIPGLSVGALPLLQMAILPGLCMILTRRLLETWRPAQTPIGPPRAP
jgi:hypothetical protein